VQIVGGAYTEPRKAACSKRNETRAEPLSVRQHKTKRRQAMRSVGTRTKKANEWRAVKVGRDGEKKRYESRSMGRDAKAWWARSEGRETRDAATRKREQAYVSFQERHQQRRMSTEAGVRQFYSK